MTTINKLPSVDSIDDGDLFPLFSNANMDARKASASLLKSYIAGNIKAETKNEVFSELAESDGANLIGWAQSAAGSFPRTVDAKLREFVSVKDFGAVGDGVTDDTAAIQSAIDSASANGGGGVLVPTGIYRVSQVLLKSYVTLIGDRAENGWARLLNYTNGSVIKSIDGSNQSPIKIVSPSTNWGLQNLVIDANKSTQTNPGVHCVEHSRTSATGSPGGLIEGCKLVNATGFGAYIIAAHPLEITNTFIMSGLYLGRTFDTLVTGCSIDGTDSKHPALWLAQSEHCTIDGCLIFRGESVSQTISQNYTVDTTNDWITVTDDSAFYDGMPVVLSTNGTYPEMTDNAGTGVNRGKNSYVVKKLGSNRLALYFRYDNPSADSRVYFNTAGAGTQTILSGVTDIVHITSGFHNRISDCRVAGSPGGAVNIALSSYIQYDNCDQWGLNWDNSATQPAITLLGSQYCNISNTQAGDSSPPAGVTRVKEAIYVVDDNSAPAGSVAVSSNNIFSTNQYNLTQGLYVNDVSTATYENRNLIDGWEGSSGITTARIVSSTFRSEPGVYYYSASPTSAQALPTSTTTDIAWTAVTKGNPRGITDGSSLVFPNTANSLVNVNGVITTNRLAGTYYVLVYVTINGVANRFYEVAEVSGTTPSLITVPFNVSQVVTTDATVTIQVFHTQGTNLTLSIGSNFSRLCVVKVADYTA